MKNKSYKYFILKNHWLARLEAGSFELDEKEFYHDGKWAKNKELNRVLNDCMMDFGDSKWYEYSEVSGDEAEKFKKEIERNE